MNGSRRRAKSKAMLVEPAAVAAAVALVAALTLAASVLGSCRQQKGTYDISQVHVRSYRYVIDPKDEDVHVVVEVENVGAEPVEELVVVVEGIGRSGEHRGEQRVTVQRLGPGERRCVAASFTNRAGLATVQVRLEPVPEEGR